MKRTFRVLILDDRTAPTAKLQIIHKKPYDWGHAHCKAVNELLSQSIGNEPSVEIFLSENAQMISVWKVPTAKEIATKTKAELTIETELINPKDVKAFLRTVDAIILDIGGIGPTRHTDDFAAAVSANFKKINQPAPDVQAVSIKHRDGIEFFHTYLNSFTKNTLIAVLTQHNDSEDAVLDAYLHAFTVQSYGRESVQEAGVPDLPYVAKFGKNYQANDWLSDLILGHYDFFKSQLSDATNRFQISFAASHDQPVMIVGESGTGKEGIARFIHEQWKRRKVRENPGLRKQVGRFQVINCGGLSEQLAQAELFGYLRGSFTGAEEHRLGKVFIAAGIDPLGKSPLKGKAENGYTQAEADLTGLREGFAMLDKVPQEQKFRTFIQEVERHLNDLFRPDGAVVPTFMRLISALEDAERKLQNAVSGGSANNDFYDRLRSKSGSLLKEPNVEEQESGWDLKYALENPIGTLFLDEFADLPLSVQTLLLRFLQDGEVQPLGFAGRILGLKVRIIVATSDSRMAEFAGEPITGDFRSPAELQRPLRIDLLHRVRFQEIRTEPVTPDNIDRILKGMIAQKAKPFVEWDEGAINYLKAQIIEIIRPKTKPEPTAPGESNRRASFGHRRELSRIVNLVWEYAKTAGPRGVRDADLAAQADGSYFAKEGLIQRLWSPAMIVSVISNGTNPYHPAPKPSDAPPGNADEVKAARMMFVEGLASLPTPVTLTENWDCKEHVENHPDLLKQHQAVNALIVSIFKKYKGKWDTVFAALEGPGFHGEPRDRDSFKMFTTERVKKRKKMTGEE